MSVAPAFIRKAWSPTFGAVVQPSGVTFRVWAPAARDVRLLLRRHGVEQVHRPSRADEGLWEIAIAETGPGDRYAYTIDGGPPRPDPFSRFQPDGVHGWSEVVDASSFAWTDEAWEGLDPRRAVIYEIHVGVFTRDGTFDGVRGKLAYLRQLGVTAIELMPLAAFAGCRNWGYDGVALFAPSRAYGRPDDLRALVNQAHEEGLAVILDAVYNHLGPEGAYLPSFSAQFLTTRHKTPWGCAVNLDGAGSGIVRRLLIENALHWIHEYHADGLRLDATHALIDSSERPFVPELAAAVHDAAAPPPLVYAEDSRNLALMVEEGDGGWNLDGVWADDFHHVVRRMLAGDKHGYYQDYAGTMSELATVLTRGWLFTGQRSRHHRAPRGTDPQHVPMRKAVVCVQNHDQVGNRALGDRLHHVIEAAPWRAAITLLLTAPTTPLLFMGQEWSASSPFQFFTDFEPDLGEKVVEGRRREFRSFPEFETPEAAARIPNPQAEDTFIASRLRWEELPEPEHATILMLHQDLLELRSEHAALSGSDECSGAAVALDDDTIALQRGDAFLVVARLRGSGTIAVPALAAGSWRPLITTEDEAYAVDPAPMRIEAGGTIAFARPGAILFRRLP